MARGRTQRKNRYRKNRKNRSQKGGGWGFTGSSSIPGTPGIVNNPQVFTAIGDCRAAEPGYWIPQSSYSSYQKGLPGMNGGSRKNRRHGRRTMKGGRYGFAPDMIPGVTPNGAAWWAGTYSPVQRIACEGSTPNPLNPGPHTPSTQPTPVASSRIPIPQGGGSRRRRRSQRGGAQQMAPATYGVGNVDSMYYYAPTAGYGNQASNWRDSVGAPVLIQNPDAARSMNQACLTTGGPPPLTGALQRGGGFLNNIKDKAKEVASMLGVSNANYTNPPAPSAPPMTPSMTSQSASTNILAFPSPPATPVMNNNNNNPTALNTSETPALNANNPTEGGKRKRKSRKNRKNYRKH